MRKPTPVAIAQLSDYRPSPPADLSPDQRALWLELVSQISGLQPLDGQALRLLIDEILTIRRLKDEIHGEGELYEAQNGVKYKSPKVGMLKDSKMVAIRMLKMFGGSPADRRRTGQHGATAVDNDPLQEFIS